MSRYMGQCSDSSILIVYTDSLATCPNLNSSCSPGHAWPAPHSSLLQTFPSSIATSFTSSLIQPQTSYMIPPGSSLTQPSPYPSLTTTLRLSRTRIWSSTHSSTPYKTATKSTAVHYSLPTGSPRPFQKFDSSGSSKANGLAVGMGAMAAGVFVLLAVILVLSLACWWKRKQWRRQGNHLHNNIRLDARYLPLEEPAEGMLLSSHSKNLSFQCLYLTQLS